MSIGIFVSGFIRQVVSYWCGLIKQEPLYVRYVVYFRSDNNYMPKIFL